MPQLSKERIWEFQKIIREDYDKEVSYEEAAEIAGGLVGYFDLLAKIDARNKEKGEND